MRQMKPDNPAKILIVNVHSSENAGDYALLLQTISYLQQAFGNVAIKILANWPDEPALRESGLEVIPSPWWAIKVWDKTRRPRRQVRSLCAGLFYLILFKSDFLRLIRKIIPENWRKIFQAYLETDLVVAVSGNQLFSSGRYAWPLPAVGFPIYLAFTFRKKTLVFPQSIGPFASRSEEQLVRYLYNRVTKLYIRDATSLELTRTLKIEKSKPSFMYDLAFTFPPGAPSSARSILDEFGYQETGRNIGMTIISNMPSYLSSQKMNHYYLSLAGMISHLVEAGNFDVTMFCQVSGPTEDEDDRIGIQKVLDQLSSDACEHVHVVNKPLTPFELKACYGLMDFFIASRLHSGIFSMAMGVPTLFIGYLHKTEGMLKLMGMEKYFIDLSDVTEEALLEKTGQMWQNRAMIKKQIQAEMQTIEKTLGKFPREIEEIFHG